MVPAQAAAIGTPIREEDEEESGEAAFHPSAPSSELFDSSTTIDPSYIISLIRKLLPHNVRNDHQCHEVNRQDDSIQGLETAIAEETTGTISSPSVQNLSNTNETDTMDTLDDRDGLSCQNGIAEDICHGSEDGGMLTGEEAWEEFGCILWDLAANKTHAEFMVENLVLDVLLASLAVFQSVRITEISLGILANLACHEIPRIRIISMKGLIDIVIDQLFLDDSMCLCEACRLLTLGLQGSGSVTWSEALQSEHVLLRILWVAENTLNPQLLEKSVGLFLAMVDDQHNVAQLLLPPLMKLGLANLLINLLACEVNKLSGEGIPDRFSALDMILQVIEALSVADNSKVITLNKDLLKLLFDLVKLPDKVELSSPSVTVVVLLANIFTDAPEFVSEVSQDFPFLQGLLDIIPFVSDDSVARTALWSIMERVLVQAQENEMSPSILHQYVSVLVDKSDIIEEDLVDHKQEDANEAHTSSNSPDRKLNARNRSVSYSVNENAIVLEQKIIKNLLGRQEWLTDGVVIYMIQVKKPTDHLMSILSLVLDWLSCTIPTPSVDYLHGSPNPQGSPNG